MQLLEFLNSNKYITLNQNCKILSCNSQDKILPIARLLGTAFAETGISDYDKLSKEQFVSLIETPKLSKYLKAPSTGEGRQNRKCRTASEKETQIRKPRHLLNAGVGVLFPCNALEFLVQSRFCALKNQAVSRLCGVS